MQTRDCDLHRLYHFSCPLHKWPFDALSTFESLHTRWRQSHSRGLASLHFSFFFLIFVTKIVIVWVMPWPDRAHSSFPFTVHYAAARALLAHMFARGHSCWPVCEIRRLASHSRANQKTHRSVRTPLVLLLVSLSFYCHLHTVHFWVFPSRWLLFNFHYAVCLSLLCLMTIYLY